MKVKELKELLEKCNDNDMVFVKLWSTEVKKDAFVKTEGNDGYPYDGYIIITANE